MVLSSQLSIRECLQYAVSELHQKECASLEAEILLSLALNSTRSHLHTWPDDKMDDVSLMRLQNYITRRNRGEPIAYITGYKEFWSLPIGVNRHTLVPRPETETLIEQALRILSKQDSIHIADLGTGSGAIALALASEFPKATIHASDICHDALSIAEKNKQQLQLDNVIFFQGNWCDALPDFDYDLIVSNPPYLGKNEWDHYQKGLIFEPKQALLSGHDGLSAIRLICQQAIHYLKSNAYLLIEHGFQQGEAVRAIFKSIGFLNINTICDLSLKERVTVGQWRK